MHEMSLALSLMEIAEAEAAAKGLHKILRVRVEYGALAGVMPDALDFCFQSIIQGTPHEGARLELVEIPLRLKCAFCGTQFGGSGQEAIWQPCPGCGETFGHQVEQGRELVLAQLEAV